MSDSRSVTSLLAAQNTEGQFVAKQAPKTREITRHVQMRYLWAPCRKLTGRVC